MGYIYDVSIYDIEKILSIKDFFIDDLKECFKDKEFCTKRVCTGYIDGGCQEYNIYLPEILKELSKTKEEMVSIELKYLEFLYSVISKNEQKIFKKIKESKIETISDYTLRSLFEWSSISGEYVEEFLYEFRYSYKCQYLNSFAGKSTYGDMYIATRYFFSIFRDILLNLNQLEKKTKIESKKYFSNYSKRYPGSNSYEEKNRFVLDKNIFLRKEIDEDPDQNILDFINKKVCLSADEIKFGENIGSKSNFDSLFLLSYLQGKTLFDVMNEWMLYNLCSDFVSGGFSKRSVFYYTYG